MSAIKRVLALLAFSGDPAKATAEIGRMGVEFKVNAGLAQYKALKTPAQGRGGRRGAAQ